MTLEDIMAEVTAATNEFCEESTIAFEHIEWFAITTEWWIRGAKEL